MNRLKEMETSERRKYKLMYLYSGLIVLAGFLLSPFQEVVEGIVRIAMSPAMLVTDYFALGGVGTALVNSGVLMLFSVWLGQKSEAPMNGGLIAAIFTVGGFALFGKNIYNVLSIILGVFLYSRKRRQKFAQYITVALFGTALAPVVSQLSFGMGLDLLLGLVLGNLAGAAIGLMLPSLAASFVKLHQGFNLYNIGFTAGMVGMVFMSLFRSAGHNHEIASTIYLKTSVPLAVFLTLYFVSMLVVALLTSKNTLRDFWKLLSHRVKGTTDFVELSGFSAVLFNMGVLGIVSTAIVLITKAPLNGPLIGGVFTVVGFGAFGKHPKNSLPVMAGVMLGYLLTGVSLSTTGAMLTVLFATTLAPIAGYFGPLAGVLAGLVHMSLISNTAYLHGGMNLYNNGFTGGFVAAVLAPLLQIYTRKKG
ncbi:MAG: DUF1576 domain-containing protein [Christensenellales bacterium]|jgi:hypothetical protein